MNELDKARQRIEDRERAARDVTEAAADAEEAEIESIEADFEKFVKPELEEIERKFWDSQVPQRLVGLFEEMWIAIEEKEGIKMEKETAFRHGRDYPARVVGAECVIERDEREERHRLLEIRKAVETWRDGRLDEIPTSVSVKYWGKDDGNGRYFMSFDTDGSNIDWKVGDGKEFGVSQELRGEISRKGSCTVSEVDIELLAERFVQALDNRDYCYYEYRPPRDDDDRGISPI
jgi:hypothetical protein